MPDVRSKYYVPGQLDLLCINEIEGEYEANPKM